MARRIRLSRARGWRKPPDAVVVARPSRWGNPFTIADVLAACEAATPAAGRALVVERFADAVRRGPDSPWWTPEHADHLAWIRAHVTELAGRDLACRCPLDGPCHADVLLDLAAAPPR
ncbi:DUF4326 domain-containing protein [Modestobacter sp. NPDC049651]|uniref:DUF4326 domain-containing protein n=1 Tax=unclassified Modestobacter TaxID=2643866 RepID=UPI00340596FC